MRNWFLFMVAVKKGVPKTQLTWLRWNDIFISLFFYSWRLKPINTHLVVLNFEHLKPVKVTPWLIKGTALDCVSKLLWICSERDNQAVCPLAIKQWCFYTSLLQLVTVLCLPSLRFYISTLSFISLCVWAVTLPAWSNSGTCQVSLPGQSCRMQSISDKGDPMDPNNILNGGVSFLKPLTS